MRDEILGQHFSIFYTEPDIDRDHPADELRSPIATGSYEEEGWRVRKDGSISGRASRSPRSATRRRADGLRQGHARPDRAPRGRAGAAPAVADLAAPTRSWTGSRAVAAHDMTDPLRTISGFAELLERPEFPAADGSPTRVTSDRAASTTDMLHGLMATRGRARQSSADIPCRVRDGRRAGSRRSGATIADRGAAVDVRIPAAAEVLAPRRRPAYGAAEPDLQRDQVRSCAKSRGLDRSRSAGGVLADLGVDDGEASVLTTIGGSSRVRTCRQPRGTRRLWLGLAICKRLVERRGGAIGVESDGRGSRFWFTLPAA